MAHFILTGSSAITTPSSHSSPTLSLVLPGLFGRLRQWRNEYAYEPEAKTLAILLARADPHTLAVQDYESTLCALFSVYASANQDLPLAALSYRSDAGESAKGFCLRADPVHCVAGIDELVLRPPEVLAIDEAEALTLAGELEAHFSDYRWRLEVLHPQRWYLHLPEVQALKTYSLVQASGRDIRSLLPQGERTAFWHGVLNELQMLLHASAVNHLRELAGAHSINSVWLWGAGVAPERVQAYWQGVWSDQALARGLALSAGCPVQAPPQAARPWLDTLQGDHLYVDLSLLPAVQDDDLQAWTQALQHLEQTWFAPLFAALKAGVLGRLRVYSCDGRYFELSHRTARWRLWRRVPALTQWAPA